MNTHSFKTTAHAKWILTGEHAVLRHHPALVFPLHDKTISLHYQYKDKSLHVEFESPYGETLLLMFWGLLETALEKIQRSREHLRGEFHIVNTIPMGAGMGFSAALCVVVTRWLIAQQWLADDQLFYFARELEHHFHSHSSGVDIAGTLYECGGLFDMSGRFVPLQTKWQPHLYLSHCETLSVTAHCIKNVEKLEHTHPQQAQQIDQEMQTSVFMAQQALEHNTPHALQQLSQAIQLAHDCFKAWHLIPTETAEHIKQLKQLGALAAKPTGAGNGGYVLSLWSTTPPQTDFELQSVGKL